jgi:Holliday junction resolvase RusA-like endonuclease
MEQNTRNELVSEEKASGLDSRVNIRVISYRARKHDPDGVSVKAVLDGLVRRGILPEDSVEEIKEITFESHISKEEKTIIEITGEEDA